MSFEADLKGLKDPSSCGVLNIDKQRGNKFGRSTNIRRLSSTIKYRKYSASSKVIIIFNFYTKTKTFYNSLEILIKILIKNNKYIIVNF